MWTKRMLKCIEHLTERKSLDLSKFADDKYPYNLTSKLAFDIDNVESIAGKGEIADNHHFLLLTKILFLKIVSRLLID